MVLKGLFCAILAFLVTHVSALDLVPSKWIWTDNAFMTVYPQAVRDFRREFISPDGKIANDTQIIIAGDNNYTLYVNGELIGQGTYWEVSQQYWVTLNPDRNVFAVAVQNQDQIPFPAAWIAAIQVNYADGSSDIIRTDAGWRGNNPIAGFQNIQFDDSSWPNVVVAGDSNSPPWHVPFGPFNLVPSKWIWTDIGFMAVNPQVVRDFRREFISPDGKIATNAQIIIAGDNNYTLYVNGGLIGQGNNLEVSQQYCVTLNPDRNVFAVAVQNQGTAPGPAAWIAAIQVNYADGSSDIIRTDAGWRGNNPTVGFQNIQFDDSSWPNAVVAGDSRTLPQWHVPFDSVDRSVTSTTCSTSPTSSSTSSNTGHSSSSTSRSTATTVGAVIGGSVILALLTGLLYFYRKAKINKASQPPQEAVPTAQATLARPMVLSTYDPRDSSTFPLSLGEIGHAPGPYRGVPEPQTT